MIRAILGLGLYLGGFLLLSSMAVPQEGEPDSVWWIDNSISTGLLGGDKTCAWGPHPLDHYNDAPCNPGMYDSCQDETNKVDCLGSVTGCYWCDGTESHHPCEGDGMLDDPCIVYPPWPACGDKYVRRAVPLCKWDALLNKCFCGPGEYIPTTPCGRELCCTCV